ncbi:hypothetical protein [Methylobacterium indicum]|uniref:Uncharacterized protein n=1 Tax=Methylobacterium indicum TaxID=1775910 RepID=A0A8H8WSQ3_9HYPH|nr:hypothetical protein [Methylobacterium indicum]BCM83595.1 hypothetical protein mvi_20560 [Methylobacterium indicum]
MNHCRNTTLDRLAETFGGVVGVGGVTEVVQSAVWILDERDEPILGIYFANEVVTRKSGKIPGQRIVQRLMNFIVTHVAVKPVTTVNTLSAQQGEALAVVERLLAADPHLSRSGIPLLSDSYVTQAGTGFDPESRGATLALAAVSIVAVAHHVEGAPDVTLPQEQF